MIVARSKAVWLTTAWVAVAMSIFYVGITYGKPSLQFASDKDSKYVPILERLLHLEEYKIASDERVKDLTKSIDSKDDMISKAWHEVWELKENLSRMKVEQNKKDKVEQPKGLSPKGRDIVLLTGYTSDFEVKFPKIARQMKENRQKYCDKHGYSNLVVDLDQHKSKLEPGIPLHWLKLYAIKEAFDKFPESQWVFWLDADALLMNLDIELAGHILNKDVLREKLMYNMPLARRGQKFRGDKYPSKDKVNVDDIELILEQDTMTFNTGGMILKRSDYIMHTLMDMWLTKENMEKKFTFPEQDVLTDLIFENKNDLFKRVGFVPQSIINSYWEDHWVASGRYHEGDFLCHFPGKSKHPESFEKAWNHMWAHLHGENPDAQEEQKEAKG